MMEAVFYYWAIIGLEIMMNEEERKKIKMVRDGMAWRRGGRMMTMNG